MGVEELTLHGRLGQGVESLFVVKFISMNAKNLYLLQEVLSVSDYSDLISFGELIQSYLEEKAKF